MPVDDQIYEVPGAVSRRYVAVSSRILNPKNDFAHGVAFASQLVNEGISPGELEEAVRSKVVSYKRWPMAEPKG